MTLITGVDASVLVSKLSRLVVLFNSKLFLNISCILRARSNKTSEAFSKSLSIFRNSMKVRFWVSLKIIVITNSTQSQMSLGI